MIYALVFVVGWMMPGIGIFFKSVVLFFSAEIGIFAIFYNIKC